MLTKPEFYKNITEEKLNELLMGDGGIPIPLLQERVNCLHEVMIKVIYATLELIITSTFIDKREIREQKENIAEVNDFFLERF